MLRHVFERIVLKRRTDGLYDPARGLTAHEEHLRLLEAMERRDSGEAVAVLRNHIQAGQKNVMADLRQRQAIRGRRVPSNSQGKKQRRKEKSWQQI
jgi:DNA-binding GntR family transcriptional regulator